MPPAPPHLRRRMLPQAAVMVVLELLCFSNSIMSQFVIENVPGYPGKLPFKLETGYIGIGERENVQLSYSFVESEGNPAVDPLILWMTGGPGCGGFYVLLCEIGPLTTDNDNYDGKSLPRLITNPYSWTKVASIIFIDQPAGAGFAYGKSFEAYFSSDTLSAKHSYEFLRKWLLNHPEYLKNPFYIAGDSYGGMIVPLVVNEVHNGIDAGAKPLINMKGYILGNPVTDIYIDGNAKLPYAFRMGLLSDKIYENAYKNCNGNFTQTDTRNILCYNDIQTIKQCLSKVRISHILEPWCPNKWNGRRELSLGDELLEPGIPIDQTRKLLTVQIESHCRDDNYVPAINWLNDKSVQKALHIREGTITEWVRCNATIGRPELAHASSYVKDVSSTISYHKNFTRRDSRVLIYSGDHDMMIPHIGTEKWINSLNLSLLSDWRPWFFEDQVAGFTMEYSNGDYKLTYATIKGAGHTAPEYMPAECLAMIQRWLCNSPL